MTEPSVGFDKALSFTLLAEGGFSSNPSDKGGATNCGIIQTTYSNWLASKGMPDAPVKSISPQEVREIYFELYWQKPNIGMIEEAGYERLAIAVFDLGVNSGPSHAIKTLQEIVSAKPDGALGPNTIHLTKVLADQLGEDGVTLNYNTARLRFYINLAHKNESQSVFLVGWENRVLALESYLKNLSEV